jgi:hypothetical protein
MFVSFNSWVCVTFDSLSNLNEKIIKIGYELMTLKEVVVEYSEVPVGHSSGMTKNKH